MQFWDSPLYWLIQYTNHKAILPQRKSLLFPETSFTRDLAFHSLPKFHQNHLLFLDDRSLMTNSAIGSVRRQNAVLRQPTLLAYSVYKSLGNTTWKKEPSFTRDLAFHSLPKFPQNLLLFLDGRSLMTNSTIGSVRRKNAVLRQPTLLAYSVYKS